MNKILREGDGRRGRSDIDTHTHTFALGNGSAADMVSLARCTNGVEADPARAVDFYSRALFLHQRVIRLDLLMNDL